MVYHCSSAGALFPIFRFFVIFLLHCCTVGWSLEVWDGGGLFFLGTRCCIKMLCMAAIGGVKREVRFRSKGEKAQQHDERRNKKARGPSPSLRSQNEISETDRKASRHRPRIETQIHRHRQDTADKT